MQNIERVIKSLHHERPDKVPYNIEFTEKAHDKMADFFGNHEFENELDNCFATVDFDGFDKCREVKPDIFEDWFGVWWNRSIDKDIGNVCNRLITCDNYADFEFPDPNSPVLFGEKEAHIKTEREKGKSVLGNLGFSLFERIWTLMGMEVVLISMMIDKTFINAVLDRILEYNLRVIENACKLDIDGMRFGDDWGQQRGLIMGPALWREFIKPRIKEMYAYVKSKGKYVLIHCCGKIQEVFPDLIECGVDVFNPFQPEVMDVFEMKKLYGDRMCFYGGISIQKTLPFGTVDQVKDEVKNLIDFVGKEGGYIAAPSHAIPGDAKPENINAMIEVLRSQ